MHATRTKSTAIYARSASAFGHAQTLKHQAQPARTLIARQFGEPDDILVFMDSTSGDAIDNWPGLMAMMQDVESGCIQRIVTADVLASLEATQNRRRLSISSSIGICY
jgi:hypothetical protein